MDNYYDEIISDAHKFRHAIEKARSDVRFTDRMKYFPRGCCDDSSELFAFYLKNKGIQAIEVTGEIERQKHVWLELGGLVVDMTAD